MCVCGGGGVCGCGVCVWCSGGQSTQIKYLSKSTDTYNNYYSSKVKVLLFNFTRV